MSSDKKELKLTFIYVVALLVGTAMGMFIPIATTHMTTLELDSLWIGTISSAFFIALAVGSVYIDRKMRGNDFSVMVVMGLFITAISAIAFPHTTSPILWLLLMLAMGTGISFNLVGIQTAMHVFSKEVDRAKVSGLYSLFFALGFAVSSITGPKGYVLSPMLPFYIGAAVLIVCCFIVNRKLKGRLIIARYPKHKTINKVPVPLYGAFVYGFAETTVIALFPMFLLMRGVGVAEVGIAVGAFIVGCVIGTLPITYLADRVGRKKCFVVVIAVSILSLAGVVAIDHYQTMLLFSFITGFVVGPFYPLTLALTVQDLTQEELPSGTALFTFTYAAGSAAGPILSALVIASLGIQHIFSLTLVFFLSLLLFVGLQLVREKHKKKFDRGNLSG
ncbi:MULTISPECIES: MFS transporter [Bacillaceae]|uniref:Major facilitator superfamily (MFS) profile domain-containing protein n=1 Tax=Alkalicoccobacillus plakortidis TaxID=444060 RepID=A0A9D5I051_9BACI|nr:MULTISPECIES: MFS transporter [Bacillaceae]KQL56242.1 hypothetical protein AN965_15085 [Alkalicoccobacillus plakortidis]